jgi:hypothetical protein
VHTYEHMAEHSMCQPGRPWPQGEAHEGSPCLAAFQSAKSRTFLLSRLPTSSPLSVYVASSERMSEIEEPHTQ